jgi:hypothetical protein
MNKGAGSGPAFYEKLFKKYEYEQGRRVYKLRVGRQEKLKRDRIGRGETEAGDRERQRQVTGKDRGR